MADIAAGAIIHTDRQWEQEIGLPHSEAVSGEDHDHCGRCGRDNEPVDTLSSPHGDHHFFSEYSCSKREGGCGLSWFRTTREGMQRDHQRGVNPRHPVQSYDVRRTTVVLSSEAYKDGWERIFGGGAGNVPEGVGNASASLS